MLIDKDLLEKLHDEREVEVIKNVHSWALAHFDYTTDEDHLGVIEYWNSPQELKQNLQQHGALVDDCDGFALMCRELLTALEVPNRLVLCVIPGVGGHLVCESLGYILDNNHDRVMTQNDLNYQWISISGYNPGDPWHEIVK